MTKFETERKIVVKELRRFNEFAGLALNKNQALDKMREFAKIYNLYGNIRPYLDGKQNRKVYEKFIS